MRSVLREFRTDAAHNLLFLKHVRRVEMLEWATEATAAELLFTVDVADTAEVRHHRAAFARVAASPAATSSGSPVELPPFQLQVGGS
jgi:hypothetical protein